MLERKTIISEKVIALFNSRKKPITAISILKKLKEKELSPNLSTIYRILNKLIDKKFINEIKTNSKESYYEKNQKKHHHHFICNICKVISCLKSCFIQTQKINLSNLLPNKNYEIQSHDFNIYGTCDNCATKATSHA
tara:strand:+ start:482 stop:892 length:411 start_codon:yes stop_codon:yes gene_type:complete